MINTLSAYKKIIIISLLNYILFTFVRVIFIIYTKQFSTESLNVEILINVIKKGIQFDGIIIGYINFLPILLVFLLNYLQKKFILFTIFIHYTITYTVIYLLLFADIPYFTFFYSHITIAIFNWINTPDMMIKQVITDHNFAIFLICFLVFIITYIIIIKKLFIKDKSIKSISTFKNILSFLIVLLLNFFISRGRIDAPLKEGDACISSNAYINQLALNGAFTFFKSLSYNTNFYDTDFAFDYVKKVFNIKNKEKSLQRNVIFNDTCKKYNIVLIIMEGMSMYNTGFKGNNLTYEIDTIATSGITFINTWSTGKHTSSGIYSVLYSYPTIWSRRPTNSSEKTKYCGLPGILKQLGYYNTFITTQSLSFDNLREFIPNNYFDTIIGIEHYRQEEVVGMYGVPDHVMFDYGIKYINNYFSKFKHPFFMCFLTTSNHTPYIIPENIEFSPKSKEISKKIVEYSSWAIGRFIKQCSKYEWYKNTLFVLVSDHGFLVKADNFDVPLCLHNIPLIFYNPHLLDTAYISDKLCMQTDIFPMIMNLLNCNYSNNTFGIDIFKDKRRFVFYSEDNLMVCQNDSFQITISKSGNAKIIKLRNIKISEEELNKIKEQMKDYALTQIQVANYLISIRKTDCGK